MNTIGDVDSLKLARISHAQSIDEFDDALGEVSLLWEKLWTNNITEVVSDSNGHVINVATLTSDFGEAVDLKPRLWSLERRARALVRAIDLTYMVEERSFADYRLGIEQRIDAIKSETKDLKVRVKDCEKVLIYLGQAVQACSKKTEKELERWRAAGSSGGNAAELLTNLQVRTKTFRERATSLAEVIAESLRRIESLDYVVDQPSFKAGLADALRIHWEYVNLQFGTWLRRILPALQTLGWLLAVGLGTYLVLGSLIPSPVWLWLLVGTALCVAIWRYYQTRQRLERRISALTDGLRYINPDPRDARVAMYQVRRDRSDGTSRNAPTFWQAPAITGQLLLDKLSKDLREGYDRSLKNPKPTRPAAIAVCALISAFILVVTVWAFAIPSLSLWPTYSIIQSEPATGSCTLAFGKVLWAGPIDLIVRDVSGSENKLTVVPPERVLRIKQSTEIPQPCSNIPNPSSAQPLTMLSILGPGTQVERSTIIIPFYPGDVKGCGPPQGAGTELTRDGRRLLLKLKSILRSCSQYRRAQIDVRGFASTKEFSCQNSETTRDLNLQLAEMRRAAVLAVLGATLSEDKQRWENTEFLLDPNSMNRWKSEELMRDARLFNDRVESIARYASIKVEQGGDCEMSEP